MRTQLEAASAQGDSAADAVREAVTAFVSTELPRVGRSAKTGIANAFVASDIWRAAGFTLVMLAFVKFYL